MNPVDVIRKRSIGMWNVVLCGLLAGAMSACSSHEHPDPPEDLIPICGGFAGLACPGAGQCVDDPSDSCDPDTGGADCSGLCECNVLGICEKGTVWDDSPSVCGCVEQYDPCIAALCPAGTECVNDDGEATCVPFEGVTCGDTTCDTGQVCCNASCGICTPPDGACIQIACE